MTGSGVLGFGLLFAGGGLHLSWSLSRFLFVLLVTGGSLLSLSYSAGAPREYQDALVHNSQSQQAPQT